MGDFVDRNNRDRMSQERMSLHRIERRMDSREPQNHSIDALVAVSCAGLLGWVLFAAMVANRFNLW